MPWIFNQAPVGSPGYPSGLTSFVAYVYRPELASVMAQAVARRMSYQFEETTVGWTYVLDDLGKQTESYQWGTGTAVVGADLRWDIHSRGRIPRTPQGWDLTWDVHAKGVVPPGEDRVGDATQVLWIYVPTFAAEGDQRFPGAALWRSGDPSQLGWAATMAQAIAKALFPPLPTLPGGPTLGPIPGTNIPLGAQSQTVTQVTPYVWLLDAGGNAVQGFAYGTGLPWKQSLPMLAGELDQEELELGAEPKFWAVHDVWETPELDIWRLISRSSPVLETKKQAKSWASSWIVKNFGKHGGFRSPTVWLWSGSAWTKAA